MPDSDHPYLNVRPVFRGAFGTLLAGDVDLTVKKTMSAMSRYIADKCTDADKAYVMSMSRSFDVLPLISLQPKPRTEYEIRTNIENHLLQDAVVSANQKVIAEIKAGRLPENRSASCLFLSYVLDQFLQQNLYRPAESSLFGTDSGQHSLLQLRQVEELCTDHCISWAQANLRKDKISTYRNGIHFLPINLHSAIDVNLGGLQ